MIGIKLHKRFGQVLLKDNNIVSKIVRAADLSNDIVLEIGPGTGNLTKKLLENSRKVIAVEHSEKMCEFLRSKFSIEIETEKLQLFHGNALKLNFPEFDKCVSNIPYHISSPLLFKLYKYTFKKAILLVQKEFAQRLIAKPGTEHYSRITVDSFYFGNIRILAEVSRNSFYPVPNVDSAIIEIIPGKNISVLNETQFFNLTRLLFSHRRKKIGTVLKYPALYSNARVESLTPYQIAELSNYLVEKQIKL